MKFLLSIVLMFAFLVAASAQNEQSPIVEKDITYKDWTYKGITTGEGINLRELAKGKKLVMVVYYAPWCPNWRHDAPIVQRLYDKYKGEGLGVVAVGEYDPLSAMKTNLESLKVTFPAVYESELRTDKQKTTHYTYRKSTGDNRNWGSPWYIFLEPGKFDKNSDVLATRANIVNGELIEAEGETFIRARLGLISEKLGKDTAQAVTTEVCDPAKPSSKLKTPIVH
jgi:thiol-disulfide isomerase/thioredoxin